MTSLISNLFYFFLACLLIVFVGVSSFEFYYEKPGPSDREQLLIINKGQSVENIASHLIDLNLIENRMAFMLVVRLKGFHNNIKFGQYMIPRSASIKQIIRQASCWCVGTTYNCNTRRNEHEFNFRFNK